MKYRVVQPIVPLEIEKRKNKTRACSNKIYESYFRWRLCFSKDRDEIDNPTKRLGKFVGSPIGHVLHGSIFHPFKNEWRFTVLAFLVAFFLLSSSGLICNAQLQYTKELKIPFPFFEWKE